MINYILFEINLKFQLKYHDVITTFTHCQFTDHKVIFNDLDTHIINLYFKSRE